MGDNNEALVGTWKLLSCFMEDVETKEKKPVWGEHPNGYIVLTSEGRWIVVQTAEGRKAPQTDDERAASMKFSRASLSMSVSVHRLTAAADCNRGIHLWT